MFVTTCFPAARCKNKADCANVAWPREYSKNWPVNGLLLVVVVVVGGGGGGVVVVVVVVYSSGVSISDFSLPRFIGAFIFLPSYSYQKHEFEKRL